MQVGLLGPLTVVGDDGVELRAPGAAKERAVLAVLGLRVGSTVGVSELIDALWGEDPPVSAAKTLQKYVSALRRRLPAGAIATVGAGYQLNADVDSVDVFVFEHRVAAGQRALAAGDAEASVGWLRQALGLWRGDPLRELADQPWGTAETARLMEGRRNCQELLGEARLAAGEARSLIGDLEAAAAAEPLRERRWAQLMLALYRCGRQAEALRAYQRLRSLLADQLGIEPSTELRALEEAILLQKSELDGPTTLEIRNEAQAQPGIDTVGELPVASPRSLSGGLLTFLFTDIEGSTRLWEQHPSRMTAVLDQHDRLVGELITAGGGEVFKTVGDAIHAVFASPSAALRAGLAVQAGVAGADWGDIGRLAVRIGVYTGEAQFVKGEWRGRALNRCARLRDAAAGNQILGSNATIELAGEDLAGQAVIIDLGEHHLRGVTRTERAFQILADAGPAAPAAEIADAAPVGQSDSLPAPLLRAARRTLIGRDDELTRVTRNLGDPGQDIVVVLIAGEPGVGKTRLAAAVAQQAAQEGTRVLYGHCDEDLRVPYQPFVEALTSYINTTPPDQLAAQLGPSGRELSRILPGMAERVAGLRPPTSTQADTERWLVFQAADRFLQAVTAERPVLLVIDDLHWAEPATFLLLRHLARAGIARLSVVATARTADLSKPDALTVAMADLAREHLLDTITLTGLDGADVAALVADRVGRTPEEGFIRAVHAETGGNPFFLHELITHLTDLQLVGVRDVDWPTPAQIEASGAPHGVRQVVVRRLGQLTSFGREVLVIASIVGEEFQALDVASAAGGPPDKAVAALEEAAASGLISETGRQAGTYRFAHALVRHTLYQGASSLRRAQLHWQVAQAIRNSKAASATRVRELAYHYREGLQVGDPAEAVPWLQAAGDQSLHQAAFEGAIENYRAAIAALDHCSDDLERRYDLLAGIAESAGALTKYEMSSSTWQAAAETAITMGDSVRLVRAVLGYGSTLNLQGDNQTLGRLINRGLELTGTEDSPERALLLAEDANEMWRDGAGRPRTQREETARESVAIARRSNDPFVLAATLRTLGEVLRGSWHAMEEYSVYQEHVQILETLQTSRSGAHEASDLPTYSGRGWTDSMWSYRGHRGVALASLKLGKRAEMLAALERASASAIAASRRPELQTMLALDGAVATAQGHFAQAEDLAAKARDAGDASNLMVVLCYAAQYCSIRAERGQTSKAINALGGAANDLYPGTLAWRSMLAGLHADLDHRDEAEEQLEKLAPNGFAIIPRDWAFPLAIRYLAELCIRLRDRERAAQLLPEVEPYTGQVLVVTLGTSIEGAADRSLGQLYWILNRPEEASRHFEAAWRLEDSMGFEPLAARSRYWHALYLSQTGDANDRIWALDLVRTAQATSSALNMATLDRQLGELLNRLKAPRS